MKWIETAEPAKTPRNPDWDRGWGAGVAYVLGLYEQYGPGGVREAFSACGIPPTREAWEAAGADVFDLNNLEPWFARERKAAEHEAELQAEREAAAVAP